MLKKSRARGVLFLKLTEATHVNKYKEKNVCVTGPFCMQQIFYRQVQEKKKLITKQKS